MERLIVQSTVALFLVFVLLPSQADCRANAGHGRRHHHGWNKLDNYESYVYKPNPVSILKVPDTFSYVEEANRMCVVSSFRGLYAKKVRRTLKE